MGMRGKNDTTPFILYQACKNLHNFFLCVFIQVSCGFVCNQNIRVVGEGSGYACPLLLASGQLQYFPVCSHPVNSDFFQKPVCRLLLASAPVPAQIHGKDNIFNSRSIQQQIIALENYTDV